MNSVIPSPDYITDPLKGTKPTTSIPFTRKFGAAYFQDLSPIPLHPSFGLDGQLLANKVVNSEKLNAVKRPSTQKSESQEPRSESNAVGSLTPKETDRDRSIKKYKQQDLRLIVLPKT